MGDSITTTIECPAFPDTDLERIIDNATHSFRSPTMITSSKEGAQTETQEFRLFGPEGIVIVKRLYERLPIDDSQAYHDQLTIEYTMPQQSADAKPETWEAIRTVQISNYHRILVARSYLRHNGTRLDMDFLSTEGYISALNVVASRANDRSTRLAAAPQPEGNGRQEEM